MWIALGKIIYRILRLGFKFLGIRTRRTRCALFHENQVLLVKNWLGRGIWTLPGGGLHFNENPNLGARREILEELRIKLSEEQLRFLGEINLNDDDINYKYMCFASILASPDFIPDRREINEAKWFDVDNLPLDRTPIVDKTITLYQSKT